MKPASKAHGPQRSARTDEGQPVQPGGAAQSRAGASNDLNTLAREERARLTAQTAASGVVSKEDFDALDRLEKLADADPSWRQHLLQFLIPAGAFLIPLAFVTILIKTDQRETQIDLDAKVTAFSAVWRDKQPLFDGSLLKAFSAAGLEAVDDLTAGDSDCSVDVKLIDKPLPRDAVNLQLLEIPKTWRVRIETSGNSFDRILSQPPPTRPSAQDQVPATVSVSGRATVETRPPSHQRCAIPEKEPF